MRLGYRRELDGLRGVAIVAVTAYHFGGHARAGFYGVDLFFVLSGFLITTLLLEEWDGSAAISFSSFYERRVRRLLPASLTALLPISIYMLMLDGPRHAALTVAAGAFYAANILHVVVHPDPLANSPIGHFWSLAEEEQFYLVWPLLLLTLLRRQARFIGHALLGIAVVLAFYRIGLAYAGAGFRRLYFAPDTHADGIVLGCALAFFRDRWQPSRRLAGAAIAVFVWFAVFGDKASWPTYGLPLVEAASGILVLYAASSHQRLLASRPLVAVGAVSYGLYVYQGVAMWLFGFGQHVFAALSITIVAAALSYRYVEQPIRRRRVTHIPASRPSSLGRSAPQIL